MITALDHFVLVCPDIEVATAEYTTLFGAPPTWTAEQHGMASAVFAVGNTALEILAPVGASAAAEKLRDITADGARLTSLVYRSDDLASDHHLISRRGLAPSAIAQNNSTDKVTGAQRQWTSFRIPDAKMAGIKTFLLQPESDLSGRDPVSGAVTSLDHLVINTPNPERAVATYGARLGLRFALDRTAEQWKTRFLFFRLGGLTLEVIHRLDEAPDKDADDTIWGLTWATDDLTAARHRLSEAGLEVSEIRTGRKPGSEVFTLRNGTQGVPTLFIAHSAR